MASNLKPSTPLPPGVVPSESRDDFNDLVDNVRKNLDEKDPNTIIKDVGISVKKQLMDNPTSALYIALKFPTQGVLSSRTAVSSTNNINEVAVVKVAAVSSTPSNAWISPEKHAQTFHIDLSELKLIWFEVTI